MTRIDGAFVRQISTLFSIGTIGDLTDGQLLERFSTGPREGAELAFAALVERHGEMVLRVCQSRLENRHDVDDAFQATFLVLLKKARALWVRDSLGPWLHQVAFRTASCARSTAARRRRHERHFAETAALEKGADAQSPREIEEVLHEEIDRLPECYRSVIVLCDLQGSTCEEAARRLGQAVGTVKCWRFRARERLRGRLQRRGLVPSAGIGTALALKTARATESTNAAEQTVRAALHFLSSSITSAEIPISVRKLVKGALKMMVMGKLRGAIAKISALVLLTAGIGAFAWVAAQDSKTNKPREDSRLPTPIPAAGANNLQASDDKKPSDEWPLRLGDAIGIGLKNSPLCRVIATGRDGMPQQISLVDGSKDLPRVRAEVMALLCSIASDYWQLGQAQIQVRAIKEAEKDARETLERKEADLLVGRGSVADVSEAAQRLEQFKLDLVTRTLDVTTNERQLRTALGLAAADGRRIVPVTPPTEARVEPNWDESLATMLRMEPHVAQARALLKQAEAEGDSSPHGQARLEQLRAFREQATRHARETLAAQLPQIDESYQLFKTASRLRNAAAQRRDAQRQFYNEGRITIDRFLDAVSQHTIAIGTEAKYRAHYNSALLWLELAKGTLLDHYGIAMIDHLRPGSVSVPGHQGAVSLEPQEPADTTPAPKFSSLPTTDSTMLPSLPSHVAVTPRANSGNSASALPAHTPPAASGASTGAKTYSFELSVKVGSTPIEVRGSITVGPAPAAESTKPD
jgi:RNA polymerase sigma factor (sigma-70 family)